MTDFARRNANILPGKTTTCFFPDRRSSFLPSNVCHFASQRQYTCRYTLYTGVCNTSFIIIHPLINQALEIENTWFTKTYGGTD